MQRELGYAYGIAGVIPLILYHLGKTVEELTDVIIFITALSLGVVSFMIENYYGIAAAVSYSFNHFVIHDTGEFLDLPAIDIFNYGLCFYCFYSFKAISYSKII